MANNVCTTEMLVGLNMGQEQGGMAGQDVRTGEERQEEGDLYSAWRIPKAIFERISRGSRMKLRRM